MGDDALGNSQRIDRGLYSGIFRIDVDRRGGDISRPIRNQPQTGQTQGYFIPRDNPFFDQAHVLEEFWALGLRNPFRFSIDEATGDVWVGDVGQDGYEEINVSRRGSNHQWSYREGPLPAIDTRLRGRRPEPLIGIETEPLFSYAHTALDRCIIGGFVYRGELHAALSDRYVYADNYSGHIRALRTDTDPLDPETLALTPFQGAAGISSLSPDSAGRILITVLGNPWKNDGRVMELVARASAPPVEPERARTPAETYAQLCARCHGANGAGTDVGSVKARDFTDPSWQRSVTDSQITQVIRDGGGAVGMSPVMPAWGETFDDEEIRDLVELIRGMEARPSP
jgi:mono/diheme cytochrome c family protein